MIKVMFVCHGNICRSPMAEMILKELARRRGIADSLLIASRGTSDEEIIRGVGNPIYPPAQRILREKGIPFEERRAVQLCAADYDRFDLLIGMERVNLRNMGRICGGDPKGKFRLLLAYTGENRDVSDPWYTRDFAHAYDDIFRGCTALLDVLTAEQGGGV